MMHRRICALLLFGLVIVAAMTASALGQGVSAQSAGLPLFAEGGSVWRIASGYNTATHVGEDPYALDFVRVDAPTSGSVVASPVAGRLGFVSSECLTIEDARGNEVLLCHLFPTAGLQRGTVVSVGDFLGTVAPPGFAGNNGLAHIHYAVHQTFGDGQILATLPFSGPYALEGTDLPATTQFGAHVGLEFVSTNGSAQLAPNAEPDVEEPELELGPSVVSVTPTSGVLFPGWNLVSWPVGGLIGPEVLALPVELRTIYAYDAPTREFLRWGADAPAQINTLAALSAGSGAFIFSAGDAPLAWALPADPAPASVPLDAGFNLVTWRGPDASVADAIASLGDAFVALHAFDAARQRYDSFHATAPAQLNTLVQLGSNQAVWVEVTAAVLWSQDAPEASPPEAPAPDEPDPVEPDPELETARVAFVLGPGCLNLRTVPTTAGNTPITCMDVGSQVDVSRDPAFDSGGFEWWRVTFSGVQGWASAQFLSESDNPFNGAGIGGEATFYHPSLAGDPMFCSGVYSPSDATIAAATSWPCGTRLRVSTEEASIEVVVQDTGLLGAAHIDLSEAAFQLLAPLGAGRIAVFIEVLN